MAWQCERRRDYHLESLAEALEGLTTDEALEAVAEFGRVAFEVSSKATRDLVEKLEAAVREQATVGVVKGATPANTDRAERRAVHAAGIASGVQAAR